MKRLILALAMVMLLVVSVSAADVTLDGKTFAVVQTEQLYLLEFQQGRFGPGETGTATLSGIAGTTINFGYQFEDPFCLISGAWFVLVEGKLLYVPADTLIFTEVVTE